MPFLGLMTVRAHEVAVETLIADRDAIHKSYKVKGDALLEARQELKFQKGQVANLSERKDQETARADLAEQRVVKLLDQLDALRPDAEKHRERVRKASMNLKQNRAKAGVASHG